MKNKLHKIFLALFSVFLLVGGGIFSACDNKAPQAIIEVSSSNFSGEDYIEIDLGSQVRTALVTAKVTGISAGMVSVNNDYQDIIATAAVYDSKSESTSITIVGKSEGNAQLVLKSHGNGEKIIRVYVYSDITSLDASDNIEDQYVVRGQANTLDPNKLLKFGSREGGESNRKDVAWSLKTEDENLSLDGNVLTIGQDYQKENSEAEVELYADSVYVDKRATISLKVISPIPDYSVYVSRTSDVQGDEIDESGMSFNLVRNADSNEESVLFAKLVVPVSSKLKVAPKIYSANKTEISDKLDITLFSMNELSDSTEFIYKIKASTSESSVLAELNVSFEVSYEKYSYKKESSSFVVKLVDVIDRIDVKSIDSTITEGDKINIFDYYNNDSTYQYGHPFVVSLGPNTVANDFAKYFIEITVPTDKAINELIQLFDMRGSSIKFDLNSKVSTALGDIYRSEAIDNKTVVYFCAGSGFSNGVELGCKFLSEQTQNVNRSIKLNLYNSPKENFDIAGITEYYLSTNKYDNKIVEVTSTALVGIDKAGVKLKYVENDKIKLTDYNFDSETGKISFKVANSELNINEEDAKLSVRIEHSNGFVSKQEIVVSLFVPLKNAKVDYLGQSTTAVSRTKYEKQNFYNASTELADLSDYTLTELIMKTGGSVGMAFTTNESCIANIAVKFVDEADIGVAESQQELLEKLIVANANTTMEDPLKNGGRLTVPSEDKKMYALVTFEGFDEDHSRVTIYRYFYLEGYTAPTRLILNNGNENIELFAEDSISSDETENSRYVVTIKYRNDNKSVTYWEGQEDEVAKTFIAGGNQYWEYDNFVCNSDLISFEIIAKTTGGRDSVTTQAIVSYDVFNTRYNVTVNFTIKNAQRVEKIIHTNKNLDDGIIYLDINSSAASDKNAVILTSVEPSSAYNKEIEYIFVPNDGTRADLISISELGVVSFKNGTSVGGTGHIYIIPKDAICNHNGVKSIRYLEDGYNTPKYIKLSELGEKYTELCKGYFQGKLNTQTNEREKIYYQNIILKLPIVVADGASQETATRLYSAEELATIDSSKHYVLMNSVNLTNEWESLSLEGGSLCGHSENITINFAETASLFNTISAESVVKNLILTGSVVNSGGMLANTNNGFVENLKVAVYSDNGKTKTSCIKGAGYVGGLVGINNGEIKNSAVEGASIEGASVGSGNGEIKGFVGGIAGYNKGTISGCRVEFYNIATGMVNTFKGDYVGGIVGYLYCGKIVGSYAYNYSSTYPLQGTLTGAFAGKGKKLNQSGEIENSFAILVGEDNKIGETEKIANVGENGEKKIAVDGSSYYGNMITFSASYWGYGADCETGEPEKSSEYWIETTNSEFKNYVRNEQRHLKFYQGSATDFNNIVMNDIEDKENNLTKAIRIADDTGILFVSNLKDSSILTDSERAYLRIYNTISVSKLLNIDSSDGLIVSSENEKIEIEGDNIILLDKTDSLTIKITSKYDFSISKDFTFKVLFALDQFSVSEKGVETSGFTIQEQKSSELKFAVKDSIYLGNSGNAHDIKLEEFSIESSIEKIISDGKEILDGKVSFNINGMSATILVNSGTKDALAEKDKEFFEVEVGISVNGLDENYRDVIKDKTKKTLKIFPTKGSQTIKLETDALSIEPAYQSKFKAILVTDDSNDELLIKLKFGDVVLSENNGIYSLNGENRVQINAERENYDTDKKQFVYEITISVHDDYKYKISDNEQYVLCLTSKTGTADNEGRELDINLSVQAINNVDMSNYKAGATSVVNGVIKYSSSNEPISVLSPGRSSIMKVSIDPTFAHYEYMTLTYINSDSATMGITALKSVESGYVEDSSATHITRGVQLARNESGEFNFRLFASANIAVDTVFDVIATFYGKDGEPVIEPSSIFKLYISYLPEAEITVNGDISALIAKGGDLDIEMLLKADQEVESITASGVKGISISPKSTWTINNNGDGTKTIQAKLYAGLNAGIIDGENVINGEFQVEAVVSRIFNGTREEKRSTAYVTIVDLLPEKAEVKNANEKNGSGVKVLDSYIGIPIVVDFNYTFNPEEYNYDHSNSEEEELNKVLVNARAAFQNNKYYHDDITGFSINYDDEIIPIYKRIKIGNQMANFVQSSSDENVYIFNYTKFRLSYNTKNNTLTVLGLSSTASPINLTLIDEISVRSSGKAIKYTIETPFAIDVVTYSDPDLPLTIKDEDEFLKVAEEGTAQNYILLNDITLSNYDPISADMFKVLDGNGYSINIESFNTEGSGTLNLALFSNIPSTTTIKNLKVNYYNGGAINVDTTSTGYSTINVAGVAINNAGIITNTQVIAYKNADAQVVNSGELGLKVNLLRGSTPYFIDDNSTIKSQIAGFVLNNTGSITNSRVGGDSIIVIGDKIEANYSYYSNVELKQFVLEGQGDMAGFVLNNTGTVVSSGSSNIQITNLSTATKTSTAGFVVSNNGSVRMSYIEGSKDKNESTHYHLTGSNISARGTVAGFVVNNGANGSVSNAYSNILISDGNETQSRTSAGFVYKNEGKINYSYSASKVEKANMLQTSFSGVDGNGNSLNIGEIELSYYYIADYTDDTSEDIQGVIENQATLINKDAVDSQNSYYGFVFNSSQLTQDGIWEIDQESKEGVKLICRNEVTISHRYYQAISEDEYVLPYSTLKNSANTAGKEYKTELGNDCNPILISTANEFKEAMGESKSIYVQKFYSKDRIFGAYRFVRDITLSDLNNELGNAEILSIDKIFTGKLEGNGFAINNISIKSSNNSVGLFGEINNGVVKNLSLEVDNITASDSYTVGSLTGLAKNSIISNISFAQRALGEGASGKGVLGRNITGAIIGSVFGDCYLTGLSATDAIVQSSYYSNENGTEDRYTKDFNTKTIRRYENQERGKFFSLDGIGKYSLAGAIIGYSDTYLANEYSSVGFIYGQNLTDSQYALKKFSVSGTIDVRGEVVGGVIGYTGINTKAKDIGLVISKGDGLSNNILSYNGFAGAIVGYANGQFHQVYAEHDETTQKLIESSTNSYYKDGITSTERGELELFKFKEATTGSYQYNPIYVGGLMGVIDSGSITVSYSKINAINYTENGAAGGIAGLVKASTVYNVPVEALGQTAKTSIYLNEVYTSGDVYAKGAFAGLFAKFDDAVKLTAMSVNVVNHYGLAIENGKDEVYAIASNATKNNINVYPSAVAADGKDAGEMKDAKSFGYMSEYEAKSAKLTVSPYKGYEESDYYFKITAVSSFTSIKDSSSEMRGAFVNSGTWDSDNWIHGDSDLYPHINFVNQLNYVYLDKYNIVSVVSKMQNSSIEVRVRGKVDPNEDVYENVDLRGQKINGFSGKLVGGTDGSWGNNFGAVQLTAKNEGENGYPGIIINNTLFETTGSGVQISNLNVIVVPIDNKEDIVGGLISKAEVIRGKFENISLYIEESVEVKTNASNNGGLLVPSAQSSSFRNIDFNFYADSDPFVNILYNDKGTNINAGLIAGQIRQNSKYDAVKVQEITIRQNSAAPDAVILKVDPASDAENSVNENSDNEINVGLYVGKIEDEGNQVASAVLTAKAPEAWRNTSGDITTRVEITGKAGTLNFGGYYGAVDSNNAMLTISKDKSYNQTLTLSNGCETTEKLNQGGLIGSANLQRLTFITTGELGTSDNTKFIQTNFRFVKSQTGSNIGLLFGSATGAFTIENTKGGVEGLIYEEEVSVTGANIGGLIGENSANITINDMIVSLYVYSGAGKPADSLAAKDTDISGKTLKAFKIGGDVSFGGFIGKNTVDVITTASKDKVKFNANGENILLTGGNTIYYGDFIGFNNGAATVSSFTSNSVAYINVPTVSVGSIIGYSQTTKDNKISGDAELKVNSASNFFIDSPTTNLKAGGMIGEIKIGEIKTGFYTIENAVFSGAFKVVNATGENHYVGGIVGSIDENISATITNNAIYGDAIYTYTGNGQLTNYYFGGVVGSLSQSENTTITGNIIAFTNNNSRKASKTTSVNAVVGNNDGIGKDNSYCSQLVLATNDFATDYGYGKVVEGYGTADKAKTFIKAFTDKLGNNINYNSLPSGHKLKPIREGSKAGDDGHMNGISYYTEKYPTGLTSNTLSNAAFIGDFTNLTKSETSTTVDDGTRSKIKIVGQHAFVSGVVVTSNVTDVYTNAFTGAIGGIAEELCDGTIFACKSMGTLSIGGNGNVNVGGIVGLMQTGRIAECYSSVDIVYRAASGGTAAGIAVTSDKMSDETTAAINYIENSYSTGEVGSYITANLYAFTNGARAWVKNSYTISHISAKDHTSSGESTGTLGIFGSATCTDCSYDKDATCTDCSYDKDATEYTGTENVGNGEPLSTAVPNVSYNDGTKLTDLTSGWVADMDNNYGYMRRNFKAFEASSSEEIGGAGYYLIPNITKFLQMKNDGKNYKLIRDIDIAKTSKASGYSTLDLGTSGVFDGNGHTISNNNGTLFDSVGTLKNLRVEGYMSGATGITGSAVVAKSVATAENVVATGLLTGDGTTVGGLFAEVTSCATNCKNYVKIDVSGKSEASVGGIAGNGVNATKCFNYSPINVEESAGSYAAGIYGQATGNVSYCGNENSVFNGYTNTTTPGNYFAAGIVGYLGKADKYGIVNNCYNTGMIKSGNKSINGSCGNIAYAAGIVAKSVETNDCFIDNNCYNAGFVEALGNMSTNMSSAYSATVDNWKITISFNCGEDNNAKYCNVMAASMYPSWDDSSNSAYVFNNGFNRHYEQTIKVDSLGNDTTDNGGVLNHINGIKITSDQVVKVAAVDEMGMPKGFFIESTRTLNYGTYYNKEVKRKQTRYTTPKYVNKSYYQKSISDGTGTDNNYITTQINLIRKGESQTQGESQTTDEGTPTSILIAGKNYAFVANGKQFSSAMNHSKFTQNTTYTGDIGNKSIEELYNAGYKFSVNVDKDAKDGSKVVSATATYNNEKLDLWFTYDITDTSTSTSTLDISYTISATKEAESVTISVGSTNLLYDGTTIKIIPPEYIKNILNEESSYLVEVVDSSESDNSEPQVGNKKYEFTYSKDEGKMTLWKVWAYNDYTGGAKWEETPASGLYEGALSDIYNELSNKVIKFSVNTITEITENLEYYLSDTDVSTSNIEFYDSFSTTLTFAIEKSTQYFYDTDYPVFGDSDELSFTNSKDEITITVKKGTWIFEYANAATDRMTSGSVTLKKKAGKTEVTCYKLTDDGSNADLGISYKAFVESIELTVDAENKNTYFVTNGTSLTILAPGNSATINRNDKNTITIYKLKTDVDGVIISVKDTNTLIVTDKNTDKNVVYKNAAGETLATFAKGVTGRTFNVSGEKIEDFKLTRYIIGDYLTLTSSMITTVNNDKNPDIKVYNRTGLTLYSSEYKAEIDKDGNAYFKIDKQSYKVTVNNEKTAITSIGDNGKGEDGYFVLTRTDKKTHKYLCSYVEEPNEKGEIVGYVVYSRVVVFDADMKAELEGVSVSYEFVEVDDEHPHGIKLYMENQEIKFNNAKTGSYQMFGVDYIPIITTEEVNVKTVEEGEKKDIFKITQEQGDGKVNYKIEYNDLTKALEVLANKNAYISFDAYGQTVETDDYYISLTTGEPQEVSSGKFVETVTITKGNESVENKGSIEDGQWKYTFKPTGADETYKINFEYNNFETETITASKEYTKGTAYEGVVLSADIDYYDNSSLQQDTNISGDGKIVNFASGGNIGGLFDSTDSNVKFMKNVGFAGTALSSTPNGGIMGYTISSTLNNVATYGTVGVYGEGLNTTQESIDGVAYEIKGSNISNISNFASISTFAVEGFASAESKLYGIAQTISEGSSNLANYGTIIGRRGKDGQANYSYASGESTAPEGQIGQTVYAIGNSAQNVTSANNYGIVKAGDGGNGARGIDGAGGTDSSYLTQPPTAGTTGDAGGTAGAGGTAYLYGEKEIGTDNNGNAGLAGSHGNDGWGGVNLNRYSVKTGNGKDDWGSHYYTEGDFGVNKWSFYPNGGRVEKNKKTKVESKELEAGFWFYWGYTHDDEFKKEGDNGFRWHMAVLHHQLQETNYSYTPLEYTDVTWMKIYISAGAACSGLFLGGVPGIGGLWLNPGCEMTFYVTNNIQSAVCYTI